MARWSGFKGLMVGLGAGALGGYFLGKALAQRRGMPYLELWQRELGGTFGAVKAARLGTRLQARFDELFKSRPRLKPMAMRFHVEQNLLPILALYQVLMEELGDKTKALELTEQLLHASLEPLRDMMSKLDRFQDPFGSFRQVARWSWNTLFPAEGWKITPVEDSDSSLAFDLHSCLYKELCEHYGTPELTPLFCRADDFIFGALPPAIRWERSHTLAAGGSACNFRWSRGQIALEPETLKKDQQKELPKA